MSPSLSSPRTIGVLVFDGVAGVDLMGTLDAFSIANGPGARSERSRYDTIVMGLDAAPIRTSSGLRIQCDMTTRAAPPLDTLVVPGGEGLRRPETLARVAPFLAGAASDVRRVVSVCTGLYGLAAAGLMNGRRAATHWRHVDDFARRFPLVRLDPDAIFVRDGKFYSSAGMTAGIDLTLALIEEDHGPALALAVARQLVVYMRRQGGQMQYSEPLRLQTRAGDRFQDLVSAIAADVGAVWDLEAMAERAGLGVRQFSRVFRQRFGVTPAALVEDLRLDKARSLLNAQRGDLAAVAHAVGYRSEDVFRRAFERRYGVNPSAYRLRFGAAAGPPPPQGERHVATPDRP